MCLPLAPETNRQRPGNINLFDKANVTFIRGAPRLYGLTSDAGRWIESQFCDECGTRVGSTLEILPDYHGIAGGTFDAPTFWSRLERFEFVRSKPDRLAIPQGIKVCKAMPG